MSMNIHYCFIIAPILWNRKVILLKTEQTRAYRPPKRSISPWNKLIFIWMDCVVIFMYMYIIIGALILLCDCSHTDWCALSNATVLTVSNITSTLAGIGLRSIGEDILCLPGSKCDEISSQCSTDEERTAALVREWLLRDPLASWRRIIDGLHRYFGTSSKEHSLGDSIVHYAEELTGECVRFRSIQWLHSG